MRTAESETYKRLKQYADKAGVGLERIEIRGSTLGVPDAWMWLHPVKRSGWLEIKQCKRVAVCKTHQITQNTDIGGTLALQWDEIVKHIKFQPRQIRWMRLSYLTDMLHIIICEFLDCYIVFDGTVYCHTIPGSGVVPQFIVSPKSEIVWDIIMRHYCSLGA